MDSKLLETTTFIFRILLTIFNVELLILAILGNAHMCISIIRNSSIHRATDYYLLNISICNFILLPFVIYLDFSIRNFTSCVEYAAGSSEYSWKLFVELLIRPHLHKMIATVIVLTLVIISVDCYILTFKRRNSNSERMTEFKRAVISILGIWLISFLSIIPGIYQYEIDKFIGSSSEDTQIFESVSFTSIYNMIHSAVFFFLPIIAMLILSFAKVCKNYNESDLYPIFDSSQQIEAQKENKNKFGILAKVVTLYLICWLPTFISNNEYYWKMVYNPEQALTCQKLTDLRGIITLRIFLLATVIVPFMWNKIRTLNESPAYSCNVINLKMSAEKTSRLTTSYSRIKNKDVYE